jgi:hypothetical protein
MQTGAHICNHRFVFIVRYPVIMTLYTERPAVSIQTENYIECCMHCPTHPFIHSPLLVRSAGNTMPSIMGMVRCRLSCDSRSRPPPPTTTTTWGECHKPPSRMPLTLCRRQRHSRRRRRRQQHRRQRKRLVCPACNDRHNRLMTSVRAMDFAAARQAPERDGGKTVARATSRRVTEWLPPRLSLR